MANVYLLFDVQYVDNEIKITKFVNYPFKTSSIHIHVSSTHNFESKITIIVTPDKDKYLLIIPKNTKYWLILHH